MLARSAVDVQRRRAALPEPEAARLVPQDLAELFRGLAGGAEAKAPEADDTAGRLAHAARVEELTKKSGVPHRYAAADIHAIPDRIRVLRGPSGITYGQVADLLCALRDNPGTVGLLGGRGGGKTWMACGLVNAFCRNGEYALFRGAMDYFLDLKATYDPGAKRGQQQVEADYVKPKLLVLDELHERGDTEWEDRMLTRLINKRYEAELATVLISNQVDDEFTARVGKSIASRMVEDGGVIVCDWPSLRESRIGRTS